MPIDKYFILRKAAELEEITSRKQMISDMNAAFCSNNDKLKELDKQIQIILEQDQLVSFKDKDPDWKERMLRFKR